MLISHKHKLVIYTLERTASTSIHFNLSELFDVSLSKNSYYKHINAQRLKEHYEIEYNTQDYHKFAIIRHPIDRVISLHDFMSRATDYHYNNIAEWYDSDLGPWLSQVHQLSVKRQLYVDRLFDFNQLNLFTNFISEIFGRRVAISKTNSNTFKSKIDDELRKKMEHQFRDDINLYQSVVNAGGELIINPYQSNA